MNKKYIDKNEKKEIMQYIEKTIVDNDEVLGYIGATNHGIAVVGSEDVILTLISMIIKYILEETNIEKEKVEYAIKIALMNEKEIKKEAYRQIKEILKDFSKKFEESEDDDE